MKKKRIIAVGLPPRTVNVHDLFSLGGGGRTNPVFLTSPGVRAESSSHVITELFAFRLELEQVRCKPTCRSYDQCQMKRQWTFSEGTHETFTLQGNRWLQEAAMD